MKFAEIERFNPSILVSWRTQIDTNHPMRIDSPPLPPAYLKSNSIFPFADTHLFSHACQFVRTGRPLTLAVAMCLFAVLGCSLFPTTEKQTLNTVGRPVLPPIQAGPDAIQLEVFFIERPAEDHLLNSAIWKEVDQLGALPAETQEILSSNGFRVGNVSSNPPPTVQKLLGMVSEIPLDSSENSKPLMGFRRYVPPGLETEIPSGIVHDQAEFQIREKNQVKKIVYDQAGCVLRMKASRLQDGWVRVDFQPEIHHGEKRMRRVAANDDFSLRMSQQVDVRVAQRFSLTMNVGERALITCSPNSEETLGDKFFCHDDDGMKKQRVLIVRVVDSGQQSATFTK